MGAEGKGRRGAGREGKGREGTGEVLSDAQLEQGRRLAKAGPVAAQPYEIMILILMSENQRAFKGFNWETVLLREPDVSRAATIVTEASRSRRFHLYQVTPRSTNILALPDFNTTSITVSDRLNVRRSALASYSLLQQMQSFCEFFGVANANSFYH